MPLNIFKKIRNISVKALAVFLVVAFGFGLFPPGFYKAEAYSNGYNYRRSITIDPAKVEGPSNFTDFSILISFSALGLRTIGNDGFVTDPQGDDIVFASDDQGVNPLDFERERYDPSTGEITAWVRVPTLDTSSDTVIYMFYGNPSITTSQENITGVWDSNYKGVWHLHETSGQHLDSTSNNNDSTSVSVIVQGSAEGKFSGADEFNGTSNLITIPDSATLDITNTGTIEAWVKATDIDAWEINTPPVLSWTSIATSTMTGAGASDFNGVDSVIVGNTQYFGAMLCSDTTETFRTATWPIGGGSFSTWTSRTATGTAAATGGCQIGVDSDGQHLWFVTYSSNAATAGYVAYATSTLDFSSISAWKSLGIITTTTSAAEGSSIDMVVVGDRAYFAIAILAATTHYFRTGSVKIDGSGWTGWTTQTAPTGGGASENCGVSIEGGDQALYYAVMCNNGTTEAYQRARSNLNGSNFSAWSNDNDPNGSGGTEFNYADTARVGGQVYHASFQHALAVTAYNSASSTIEGGTLTWISRKASNGDPDGSGSGESTDAILETDGKNLYYSAFAHDGANASFFIASSSLDTHPIVSKFDAYELLQTGRGYAFDWAGKPTTFATTTTEGVFYHVAVTHNGSSMNYYLDGQLVSSTTVPTDFVSNTSSLLIAGGFRADGSPIYYHGILDEIRISAIARSADWIQTQYNNQNATSTFYIFGNEETDSGSSPSVFTRFPTNVGPASATVHGAIVSDGGASVTEHGFAYGTSANLTTNTSTTTLGALSLTEFSQATTTLLVDTTYYYRAYATNAIGTGLGAIRSFITNNATIARKMRLFEGFFTKLTFGRINLYQQ